MARLRIQWLDPSSRTPRVWSIPSWTLALFPLLLLGLGLALWGVLTAKESPERVRRNTRELAERNDRLSSELSAVARNLDAAEAAAERAEDSLSQYRDLAGLPAKDASPSSGGFFGGLFGPRTPDIDVDTLFLRARRLREQNERVLQTLEAHPGDAARWPTIQPVRVGTPVVENYGRHPDPFTGQTLLFQGTAYGTPLGSPVWTTGAGQVENIMVLPRWGLTLEVNHGDGVRTIYAHLTNTLVGIGATVIRGQVIGTSGKSGNVTGPRLFYAIFRGNKAVDPLDYVLPRFPEKSRLADSAWFEVPPEPAPEPAPQKTR